MKKFILSLFALVMSITMNATIINLGTEVNGTDVAVYWQSDSASTYYDVALYSSVTSNFFCEGAWSKAVFEVDSVWMSINTDLLLDYAMNYTDLPGQPGVTDEVIAVWKAGWEASVDSVETGLTLKSGMYIVSVTGYDATFEVSEEMNYVVFTVVGTQAIEFVPTNNKSTFKMFDTNTNNIYIIRDNNVYDILGNVVKQY